MRAARDPDVVLVQEMLAPPPLEDARSSLEFWRRRRRGLPLHRRAARREADEMVGRWLERVRAAERARFDASWPGRLLGAVGLARYWPTRPAVDARPLLAVAWMLVPRRLKIGAAAAAAVVFFVLAGTFAVLVLAVGQLV